MVYFEITQEIIDYIEKNLYENIELDAIAKRTHFSLMQVYRIFSLVTGMTLKEYIRTRRMTKALLDIKYSKESILNIALRSGYTTHESFSRAFVKLFGILPNEYRKASITINPASKPEIMKNFLHKASHEATNTGLYEKKIIDIFFVTKPAMKFIGKVNGDHLPPEKFYDDCIEQGIEKSFAKIQDSLFCCGACLNQPNPYDMHMFCMAVPIDYDGLIPDNLEKFDIQASEYAVFYCNSYPIEEHGSVIKSAWDSVASFNPENYGYLSNMEKAPIIEIDDELGYFLHIPVQKRENEKEGDFTCHIQKV
ncbi:helix-turn-helix domain-containing protein [Vallitalea okinawensis]|uniref:helix-turn-helix domain-containing protein n=1 Tax=Vallitalea okinawensis TaxID=2078660 RepID=UPI000CFBAD24|nr:helix-turn-helix domain-containing protein [Vallitalea okinawensis]